MGIPFYHQSLNIGDVVKVAGTGGTFRHIKITAGPREKRARAVYSGPVIGGNDNTAPPNAPGREAWFYVDDVMAILSQG